MAGAVAGSRPRHFDSPVDPAAESFGTPPESDREPPGRDARDFSGPPDREPATEDRTSAAPEPERHPLLYLAVDTVTGEVLWQVEGDPVPVAPAAAVDQAYGPQATIAYRRDEDDVPHGISRLV